MEDRCPRCLGTDFWEEPRGSVSNHTCRTCGLWWSGLRGVWYERGDGRRHNETSDRPYRTSQAGYPVMDGPMRHEQAKAITRLFGDGRCQNGDHPQHQDVISAVICNDTYRPGWLIDTGWLSRRHDEAAIVPHIRQVAKEKQHRGTDR